MGAKHPENLDDGWDQKLNDASGFQHVPCAACGSEPDEHQPLMSSHVRHQGHLLGQPLQVVICTRCGLAFLNPQPKPEALSRFYSEEYYANQSPDSFDIDKHLRARKWQREVLFEWVMAQLPDVRA